MNTIVKLSVASALMLGYATAQASISQPASGSSDLILFAEIINVASGNVVSSYARDTGVSINSVLPSGSLNPAGTPVPSTGFPLSTLASFSPIGPDANMASFLSNDAAGDVVEWSVQAGQYTGATSSANFAGTGNAKFITTAQTGVSSITSKSVSNLTHWSGIDTTVTALNANIAAGQSSVVGSSAAAAGIWDPTVAGGSIANWLSNGPLTYPGVLTDGLNTTQSLFGVTGNGGNSTTKVQVYSLGQLTLTGNGTLQAVPIPAALWLFGSGLLGLAGVGRRKAAQA